MTRFLIATLFVLSACSANKMEQPMNQPQVFPTLKAQTLAGNNITFPEDIKGKKSFIAMVFEDMGAYMKPQNQANAWANAYEQYLKPEGVVFYEIPMMASAFGMMRGWVDNGMRSGIPSEKHDNIACFYGDKGKYKKALSIGSYKEAHIFILDETGNILFYEHGGPTDEGIQRMKEMLL
ncbi:MAG: hypothetical protein AAFQ83_12305 [Bacteroidota bacterium]